MSRSHETFKALPWKDRLRIVRSVDRGTVVNSRHLAEPAQKYANHEADRIPRGAMSILNAPGWYWGLVALGALGAPFGYRAPTYWGAIGVLVLIGFALGTYVGQRRARLARRAARDERDVRRS